MDPDETQSPMTMMDPAGRRSRVEHALARGAVVGRYVLLDRLGAGGMGVVYAAYDPELHRRVALKLMTSGDQARMLREAQSLAKLAHPNVVAIHDVGSVLGTVFIAMELVEGKTLLAWLRETKRPWREIVAMFIGAARGLAAAHEAGIVHRDFKPGNVLVGRDGRARVVDFGVARAASEAPPAFDDSILDASPRDLLSADLTQPGNVLGTPIYMPPEARRGAVAGAEGDQFSFCVSLYEALYGIRPYERPRDAREPLTLVPPPADSRVPAWLRKTVLRGLSERPQDRFPSMAALIAALEADPSVRRRRVLVVAIAALAAAGAAAAAVQWRAHRAAADDDPCQISAPLAGAWDDSARARVHDAFTAARPADGEDHFARAARALDEHAQSWLDARSHVCAQTRDEHAQPEALLLIRLACFDRHRDDLAALVALFEHADEQVVRNGTKAVRDLGGPRECANATSLAYVEPPPLAVRPRVAELERALSKARALRATSKRGEADELVRATIAGSRQVGYRPLLADALLHQAYLDVDVVDAPGAKHAIDEALQVAISSRADTIAARAAAYKVFISNVPGASRDELATLFAEAQAWAARADDVQASAFVELVGGVMLLNQGHPADALVHLERAAAMDAELFGNDSYQALRAREDQVPVLYQLGRFDDAIALGRHIADSQARLFGASSPELARTSRMLGWGLSMVGQYAEASAVLVRAIAIPDTPEGLRGALLCELSRAQLGSGDITGAIHSGEDGLARMKASGPGYMIADSEDPLAAAYLAAKRFTDVLAVTRECLAEYRRAQPELTSDAVSCLAIEGTAQLELGNVEAARSDLEQALALQTPASSAPGVLAVIRYQLARALVAGHGDLARAHELTADAHEELARYSFRKPLLDQLDAWRRDHKLE